MIHHFVFIKEDIQSACQTCYELQYLFGTKSVVNKSPSLSTREWGGKSALDTNYSTFQLSPRYHIHTFPVVAQLLQIVFPTIQLNLSTRSWGNGVTTPKLATQAIKIETNFMKDGRLNSPRRYKVSSGTEFIYLVGWAEKMSEERESI